MWHQSVWTSVLSATIASKHLKNGGFLALTGAQPALAATPTMIGYGMAKSAVHHLTRSLASPDGGLPQDAMVAAILPVTLDTPMNRKWMPKADFSTWTPLTDVARFVLSKIFILCKLFSTLLLPFLFEIFLFLFYFILL